MRGGHTNDWSIAVQLELLMDRGWIRIKKASRQAKRLPCTVKAMSHLQTGLATSG